MMLNTTFVRACAAKSLCPPLTERSCRPVRVRVYTAVSDLVYIQDLATYARRSSAVSVTERWTLTERSGGHVCEGHYRGNE